MTQVKYRWVCAECELVSLWTEDGGKNDREAERHTKDKRHATSTYLMPVTPQARQQPQP